MVKCSVCKQEIENIDEHSPKNCPGFKVLKEKYPNIRIERYVASLKPTKYRCPDCKEVLKELVPDEYFLCEKCDVQFEKDELSEQKHS